MPACLCVGQITGWYHSHPTFQPEPSLIDIENQHNYQARCRMLHLSHRHAGVSSRPAPLYAHEVLHASRIQSTGGVRTMVTLTPPYMPSRPSPSSGSFGGCAVSAEGRGDVAGALHRPDRRHVRRRHALARLHLPLLPRAQRAGGVPRERQLPHGARGEGARGHGRRGMQDAHTAPSRTGRRSRVTNTRLYDIYGSW